MQHRSQHTNTRPHKRTQSTIENHLEKISTDVVELDALLFDEGNPEQMKKHAQNIASRATRIANLLR